MVFAVGRKKERLFMPRGQVCSGAPRKSARRRSLQGKARKPLVKGKRPNTAKCKGTFRTIQERKKIGTMMRRFLPDKDLGERLCISGCVGNRR